MTAEEETDLVRMLNAQIRANLPVSADYMSLKQATDQGILALFGEKYGDDVRVISMGEAGHTPFSEELCGGCHVDRTGELGFFVLLSEGSVASGVRRIEACVGEAAEKIIEEQQKTLSTLSAQLKTSPLQLPTKVKNLLEGSKSNISVQKATGTTLQRIDDMINAVPLTALSIHGYPIPAIRSLLDEEKAKISRGFITLLQAEDNKVSAFLVVKDMKNLSANTILQAVLKKLGGKGGGRPDSAQGGFAKPISLEGWVTHLEKIIMALNG
jgi:alanyl-tRNA synthetase